MNTLKNHTIIYDDDCPMCHWYTNAFIKTGMLDKEGRIAYNEISKRNYEDVDWKRACNEIALIDKDRNQVTYGIQSLFKILGNYFPILKPLFCFRPFAFVMEQLYFFISYNRKVIAPTSINNRKIACWPDLKIGYRLAYILISWLLTAWILQLYSALLVDFVVRSDFYREFLICGGQIAFQAIFMVWICKEKLMDYLGNLMTVSLLGALLLLPAVLLSLFTVLSGYIYLAYFLFVVSIMFAEHIRRVRLLALPAFLSASWVIYRLMVLLVIL